MTYLEFPVIIGEGKHTFPYRTRSLSLLPSMVVRPRCCARVDCCRVKFFLKKGPKFYLGPLCFYIFYFVELVSERLIRQEPCFVDFLMV